MDRGIPKLGVATPCGARSSIYKQTGVATRDVVFCFTNETVRPGFRHFAIAEVNAKSKRYIRWSL